MRMLGVTLAFAITTSAAAQEWRADAKRIGLDGKAIEHLARERVLMTNRTYRQVFEPYRIAPGEDRFDAPVFITTDAVLHAYHRLTEASLLHIERGYARRLPTYIRAIATELRPTEPTRAHLVIGIAHRLLDPDAPIRPEVAARVAEEVSRIVAANASAKAAWLPSDALPFDYARFRPQGFCEGEPVLERHFRAVRFLQSAPFDLAVEHEAAAFRAIGRAARWSDVADDIRVFVRYARAVFGRSSKPDLASAMNDGATPTSGTAHVLVAAHTWDNDVLQRGAENRADGRASGLDVVAALESEGPPNGYGLHDAYFRCLVTLLEPPADAPPFMHTPAWRAKSVQTALAGWAQHRHAWALQITPALYVFGLANAPPGFVEPNPAFFDRLAGLAAWTGELARSAPHTPPTRRDRAAELRETVDWIEAHGFVEGGWKAVLTDAPKRRRARVEPLAWNLGLANTADQRRKWLRDARDLADKFDADDTPPYDAFEPILARWPKLVALCRDLATLARRQQAGKPTSEDDRRTVLSFGPRLADILDHEESQIVMPTDDVPRIVVAAGSYRQDGSPITNHFLCTGTARPRALFVLYPHDGRDLLCHGAVIPYYEVHSATPLTEPEWRGRLDGEARPAQPEWIGPLVGPGALGKPDFRDRR